MRTLSLNDKKDIDNSENQKKRGQKPWVKFKRPKESFMDFNSWADEYREDGIDDERFW